MTKQECIEQANKAKMAAERHNKQAAILAAAFGGTDELTKKAFADADAATLAAVKWEWMATIHPKTRDSIIRQQELPSWMFAW